MTRAKSAKTVTSLSAVYTEQKANGAKLKKSFEIPVDYLVVDHDKNFRTLNKDRVDAFAESYLLNRYVPAILVHIEDGAPTVRAGFHRVAGFLKAQESNPELTCIECKEIKGTESEVLAIALLENDGEPLTYLQRAEGMLRMQQEGTPPEEISQVLGVSRTDVSNKLCLAEADDEIKAMVRDDQLSATNAVQYIIKHGVDALAHIKHDLERAANKGKTRVTAKSGGSASPFSAAKARNALELVTKGLDYEAVVAELGNMSGDVDLQLTLDVGEVKELIEYIEDYTDHKGE